MSFLSVVPLISVLSSPVPGLISWAFNTHLCLCSRSSSFPGCTCTRMPLLLLSHLLRPPPLLPPAALCQPWSPGSALLSFVPFFYSLSLPSLTSSHLLYNHFFTLKLIFLPLFILFTFLYLFWGFDLYFWSSGHQLPDTNLVLDTSECLFSGELDELKKLVNGIN